MVLHIGGEEYLPKKNVVMILTPEAAQPLLQSGARQVRVAGGRVRSVVAAREAEGLVCYLSPISGRTLLQRAERESAVLPQAGR